MSSIQTNFKGRLKNTHLPWNSALMPLFEAVVNSIHSIDDRILKGNLKPEEAQIQINIIREDVLDGTTNPNIIGFEIVDNGIGFDSQNYNSFQTLDSEYKVQKGCKGIGRLLWLKEFSKVVIESIFEENGKYFERKIRFSEDGIDSKQEYLKEKTELKTSVRMTVFKDKKYESVIPKTIEIISQRLLDHCMWYFIRVGGAPKISVGDKESLIFLGDLFESIAKENKLEKVKIKKETFDLIHIKFKSETSTSNKILYGAAERLVLEEDLKNKVAGLFGELNNNGEKFWYACFVTSDYLTKKVSPERLEFLIPPKKDTELFEDEISFEEICEVINKNVNEYLKPFLEDNKKISKERVQKYIEEKAPRYRSIFRSLSEEEKCFDLALNDKQLELRLHSKLMEAEEELIEEGHDLMQSDLWMKDKDEYLSRLNEYLKKASDLKQSDLAAYVSRRKVVIDLFEKALTFQDDGKYIKEEIIHNLFMPMRTTSEECSDSNLWLIDERLAFHNFLASDKTLSSMPITSDKSNLEPDICSLNICDNPLLVNPTKELPLASITLVEFKRPMRNDANSADPIKQVFNYLKRIRDGGVKTNNGRLIPESKNIPGYCYILCDLTSTMIDVCEEKSYVKTSDGLGYFGFNSVYNAYIEVISFDRLLRGAKERNKAFFDKLGLPSF